MGARHDAVGWLVFGAVVVAFVSFGAQGRVGDLAVAVVPTWVRPASEVAAHRRVVVASGDGRPFCVLGSTSGGGEGEGLIEFDADAPVAWEHVVEFITERWVAAGRPAIVTLRTDHPDAPRVSVRAHRSLADGSPIVQLERDEIDLGALPIDERIDVVARLTNHGDETAHLERVIWRSGTAPTMARAIDPGETVEITLPTHTGFLPDRKVAVTATFQIRGQVVQWLRAEGRTEARIAIDPQIIDGGPEDDREIVVRSLDGEEFRIVRHSTYLRLLGGDVEEVAGTSHTFRFDNAEWRRAGEPRTATIATDHPGGRSLRVAIRPPREPYAHLAPTPVSEVHLQMAERLERERTRRRSRPAVAVSSSCVRLGPDFIETIAITARSADGRSIRVVAADPPLVPGLPTRSATEHVVHVSRESWERHGKPRRMVMEFGPPGMPLFIARLDFD